jgi:hypothetical protein
MGGGDLGRIDADGGDTHAARFELGEMGLQAP